MILSVLALVEKPFIDIVKEADNCDYASICIEGVMSKVDETFNLDVNKESHMEVTA